MGDRLVSLDVLVADFFPRVYICCLSLIHV